MAEQDLERSEQATPKKRLEARQKGQVASSREIPSVVVLLGAMGIFAFLGSSILSELTEVMRRFFLMNGAADMDPDSLYHLFLMISKDLLAVLAPFVIVLTLMGVASQVAQVGFHISPDPLGLNLARLNPIQGFKRIFSQRGLVELLKGFLKIGLIGYLAYHFISGEIGRVVSLSDADIGQIFIFAGSLAFRLMVWLAVLLVVLAVLDYAFQKWRHEKDLRMTPQEVKEEYAQSEGNPMIKTRIRTLQRALSRNRMIAEVARADAVVTNPQHLAVALAYEQNKMKAPKVVAKGAGIIAGRIKEEAKKYRVPIVEDKPLAQALYRTVEIGQEIPANLYKAVAEILAYVYRLGKQRVVSDG